MVGDPQPFFTPNELRTLTNLRPQRWRQWWSEEPLITKVFVAGIALVLALAVYDRIQGETDVSAGLFLVPFLLAVVVVVYCVGVVIVAAIRYLLHRSGVAALWERIRGPVVLTVRVVFWGVIGVGLLITAWPYLSLDPVKCWYALKNEVPADRIYIEKEPHDCEFQTAPLGSKNCHYTAKQYVERDENGKRSLIVAYEKVQD